MRLPFVSAHLKFPKRRTREADFLPSLSSSYRVDFANLAALDEDEEDEFYDSDHSSDSDI